MSAHKNRYCAGREVFTMREQYKLVFDHFWTRLLKEDFGRPGRIVSRIAILFVVAILVAVGMLAAPAVSSARVALGVSVYIAPPALPIYIQPPCPGPDYIWTPGYWAWDPDIGYYWVPGTWVLAPFPGALWTPGYWGWSDGVFVWYAGYWGLTVGFYGGINYGFGYTGYGYEGGHWDHGAFYYNRTVNNINVTNITHVYSRTVSPATTSRVSYNGGRGGITSRPTSVQLAAARERHSPPTGVQMRNERAARSDPRQRAAVNHGRPAVAATPKPGIFSGSGVVQASRAGAPYKAVPSGRAVGPSTHARSSHPVGGIERNPRVTSSEKTAPHARIERQVAPRNESARPANRPKESRPVPEVARHQGNFHAYARPSHPAGGIERNPRVTVPEKTAPPARVERHVAPRNESARPANRPNESRPVPEVARHQGNSHSAPQREGAHNNQFGG